MPSTRLVLSIEERAMVTPTGKHAEYPNALICSLAIVSNHLFFYHLDSHAVAKVAGVTPEAE
jgi:hypothetical protein